MNERMGGRAVEGTGLENRQACKRLVGSNPTPSATNHSRTRDVAPVWAFFLFYSKGSSDATRLLEIDH